MLDSENQQRVDNLASKVSRLKNLALDIDDEAADSNRYLDSMGGDYESTQGLLGGSVHRLSHMVQANRGNRKLMCYLVLGLVLLFFLTYYLISKVSKWHRFQTRIEKITPGFKSMKCFWETLYSLSMPCRVPCSPLVFLTWDESWVSYVQLL